MSQLAVLPLYRLTDANGVIIPNGRLYTFLTGTVTAAPTYTTSALSVSHGAYVQANSAGLLPPLYFDPTVTYRCQVRAAPYSSAVSGMDFDPVNAFDAGSLSFLQLGSGAEAQTVEKYLQGLYLTFEAFGAVGDGATNDAAAFTAAITAAQTHSLPIRGKRGANYGLGATSWAGIAVTLTEDLAIDWNGSTFTNLALPTQSARVGNGKPIFKIDGTASNYRADFANLYVDCGGFRPFVFDLWRCKGSGINCHFFNGDMAPLQPDYAAIGFYLNACVDFECTRCSFYEMGYGFYLGHSNADMFSNDTHIHGNAGEKFWKSSTADRGDFVVGVQKGSHIHDNHASGLFGGVAMGGYDGTSMVSSDCHVHDNHFSDFRASGVQTDIVGTISAVRLNAHDNICTDPTAGATATPIYMLQATKSRISGNQGDNTRYGVLIDKGFTGEVSNNRFYVGTEAAPVVGLSATGQLGTIADVLICNNDFQGFPVNIGIGGGGNAVSNITVVGNKTKGGARGLQITDTVTGIWVDGNNFAGGHTTADIDNDATNGLAGVQFGINKFATATGVTPWLPMAQGTPTAKTADATLTIAELLTSIVTTTSASAVALTLPTGTLTDAGLGSMSIGMSFDWAVINLGSASGAITMTAGTDHTYVGNAVVAISTTAQFRTRKTAANTFITYRLA